MSRLRRRAATRGRPPRLAGGISCMVAAVSGLSIAALALMGRRKPRVTGAVQHTAVPVSCRPDDVARIRRVLDSDALVMHFQPIVWMPTAEVVGYEALARFPSPPARPDQWFDLAERCGMRVELEVAAVRTGLEALQCTPADSYISLNVSPDTLLSDGLLDLVSECPGHRIVLELTEHVPIADYEAYLPRITALRNQGVRLAVDDAGAGYSSLRHILVLRPEIIKLDRTLTSGVDDDTVRRALLISLASFAHATKTTLVAEGVETIEELAALIEFGVAFGQGYYFDRPMPLDRLGDVESLPA